MTLALDGVDYSFDRPDLQVIRSNVSFVGRYLTGAGKAVTATEAAQIRSYGLGILLYMETSAGAYMGGEETGRSHARQALERMNELAIPTQVPAIYCIDQDLRGIPGRQYGAKTYAAGVAAVHAERGGAYGFYGGYDAVALLAPLHPNASFVQTYAWSQDHWHPRAYIRQYRNNVRYAGAVVDHLSIAGGPFQLSLWASAEGRPLLKRGSTGSQVRYVQTLLAYQPNDPMNRGLACDGIYGPKTEAAIIRRQHVAGIAPDGIVGPNTWAYIINDLA
jgi:hypothetical protein